MKPLWLLHFTSIYAMESMEMLMERFDSEGELLAELALTLDSGSLSDFERVAYFQELEDHYGYASSFLQSLVDVISPGSTSLISFDERVGELVAESISGAQGGCGLCFGILGVLASVSPGYLSPEDLNVLSIIVPTHIHREHPNFASALFATAMGYSSTLGTMAIFRRMSSDKSTNSDLICDMFAESFSQLGRDSASEDVLSEILPPGIVDFKTDSPPRNFISADLVDANSEGLDYYIHLMKENAASLSAAMMFGSVDILELLDLEEDLDMDEVIRSAEEFIDLDETQIAEDLIATVNTVRYNLNAVRFNKGLTYISSSDSSECLKGVKMLGDLIASQSLLSKAFFLLMKHSFFSWGDQRRSQFLALAMSEVGVPSGHINALQLFDSSKDHDVDESKPRTVSMMHLDSEGRDCVGKILSTTEQDELDCLNFCLESPDCVYAVFPNADGKCATYSDCQPGDSQVLETRIYSRTSLEPEIDCFILSIGGRCVEQMHIRTATLHDDIDSMHWLMYYYADRNRNGNGLFWATRAAALGDPEAKFYVGVLTSQNWDGHSGDWDEAWGLFHEMLTNPRPDIIVLESIIEEMDDMQRLEYETVQEIAWKLGIHDVDWNGRIESRSPLWVQRAAGGVGIILLYYRKYSQLLPRLISLSALIPVLFFLMSRRHR